MNNRSELRFKRSFVVDHAHPMSMIGLLRRGNIAVKALMLAVGLSWLVLQSAPVGAQCVDASKINPDICLPGSSISAWSLQLPGAACSDERTCTSSDVCQADCSCAGSLLACDDGLPLTTEQCDEATTQCKVSVLSGCAIDQACWRSRTGTRR